MNKYPDRLNGKWLIVKPIPKTEELFGEGEVKIILPVSVNADLSQGRVMKVSPEIADVVKEGEVAIFPSKSGQGQIIKKEQHIWLELHQLWAIDTDSQPQDKGDGL